MKVSIIVPVYNVREYLPRCLESIRSQSLPDWEAILVDDGSTDGSGGLCDSFAAADPRFRVIHQSNSGAANAKNRALDQAGGAYIAFVDGDDYVESHWLETALRAARAEGADIVEYGFDNVYSDRVEPALADPLPPGCFSAEEYLARYPREWPDSLFCTKLFRRQTLGALRFPEERRCIDDEFFTYQAVSRGERILRLPDVLYHYRQRASGVTRSEENRLQITEDALEVLTRRYRWISRQFPKLRREYLRHDVRVLFCFARYRHNGRTARKFRRVARYCLGQALLHWPDRATVRLALKTQTITTASLLKNEESPSDPVLSRCFR